MRGGQPRRLLELRVGHVDPDDASSCADLEGSNETVHAGTAPKVDDVLAWTQIGEMKEMADTRKRVDRLGRNSIEILRGVSEALRHRTSHLEVEIPVRVGRHVGIHALDLL